MTCGGFLSWRFGLAERAGRSVWYKSKYVLEVNIRGGKRTIVVLRGSELATGRRCADKKKQLLRVLLAKVNSGPLRFFRRQRLTVPRSTAWEGVPRRSPCFYPAYRSPSELFPL